MKLALGTVQFGMVYGALNATGRQVAEDEVAAILNVAAAAGIDTLDTARAYGESEQVLGRLAAARQFDLVTKVAPLDGGGAEAVARSVEASLVALGADRLAGLMLHRAADLLGSDGDAVWRALEAAPAARIGLSVYEPAEAMMALDRYPVRLMQVPMNVFDRRFAAAGVLDRAASAGCAVHVRSAFLQGVVLADPDDLPAHLVGLRPAVTALAAEPRAVRIARALAPLMRTEQIARIIVGVDTADQLAEIVAANDRADDGVAHFECPAIEDETLVDPRRWPAG